MVASVQIQSSAIVLMLNNCIPRKDETEEKEPWIGLI